MIHVMIGGAFGAITRYVLSLLFSKTNVFPWGTLTINLIGSFLLGIVIAAMSSGPNTLLLGTGFSEPSQLSRRSALKQWTCFVGKNI